MATAAKKTAPAAKKAAPAPAPAAKKAPVAAKKAPAPAPAPEPVEDEGVAVEVGTQIRFLGYPEGTDEADQILTAGEVYEVAGITEAEGEDPGGDPYVTIPNPSFNAKKKESDENPKTISVSVLPDEYEIADGEEEAAEEVVEEAAAPAPAAKKSVGKAKKAAAEPAPEEPAEEVVEEDEMPDLEGEDEAVLELVNSERNLVEVAQELEATAAESEYRLAGVLFHVKKNKAHLTIEDGTDYSQPKGFEEFLRNYFNIEYRKAMYLIDIYMAFTLAQVPNPAARMASMGWAKASKIAKPMMAEGANADDLLELADKHTVKELSEAIKEQITVGGTSTPGVKVTRTTLKFRLLEQDGTTATHILAAVRSAQSLKDDSEALMFILNDWAAANAPAAVAAAAPKATTAVGKKAPAKAAATAAPAAKKAAPVPPKPKTRA